MAAGSNHIPDCVDGSGLYRRFVELTATGASDVDLTPLRFVADAFLLGKRRIVEAFED